MKSASLKRLVERSIGAMRRGWPVVAAVCAVVAHSRAAFGCGGTFCDGGPQAMPVDQTGENILFAIEDGMVEAHIQIQYTGDAERFAWVLPLPTVPETISVGSQPLFVNLLNSTVPSYGFSTCGSQTIAAVEGGGGSFDAEMTQPGPQVILSKVVGAFEVTVLGGGSAAETVDWLDQNGYEQIPEAESIFADYVNLGYVFAALKLVGGAGIDEIHPIVVRYAGETPCVPLKLTSVAAVDDMGVRAFFLGDERVVPTNYRHVTLNPVVLDWANFAQNYTDVVTRAVDAPLADGRAFVTEYAGASNVVPSTGIYSASWDANAVLNSTAMSVVGVLRQQGLLQCTGAICTFSHPLIEPLLDKYLPVPEGVDKQAFYSCVDCYADQIDQNAFDSAAMAREFLERIVIPGRDALALLGRHSYLTRLFTTISPDEMTVDPTFAAYGELPAVPNRNIVTRAFAGDGSSAYALNDEQFVLLGPDGMWPSFDDEMPYALRIEELTGSREWIELVDNSDTIAEELERSNGELAFESSCLGIVQSSAGAAGGGPGPVATVESSGGASEPSQGGAAGEAGAATDDGEEKSGCECGIFRPSAGTRGVNSRAYGLGLLCLFGLLRRRGQRRALRH